MTLCGMLSMKTESVHVLHSQNLGTARLNEPRVGTRIKARMAREVLEGEIAHEGRQEIQLEWCANVKVHAQSFIYKRDAESEIFDGLSKKEVTHTPRCQKGL